jgi:hypothetical protein
MTLHLTIVSADMVPSAIPLGATAWFVLAIDQSPQLSSPGFPLSAKNQFNFTIPLPYVPAPTIVYLYISLCTYRLPSNEVFAICRSKSRLVNIPMTGIPFTLPLLSTAPPGSQIVTISLTARYAQAVQAGPGISPQPAGIPIGDQPMYPPPDAEDENPYAGLDDAPAEPFVY